MHNEKLTSLWTQREENAVDWWIKLLSETPRRSRTIKFPKNSDYVFGDLAFRLSIQSSSVQNMKVSLGLFPLDGNTLENTPNFNSRKFPVVSLAEARAKIFLMENQNQNLSLGFQPIIIVVGAEPGEIDTEAINYPASITIKEVAVSDKYCYKY